MGCWCSAGRCDGARKQRRVKGNTWGRGQPCSVSETWGRGKAHRKFRTGQTNFRVLVQTKGYLASPSRNYHFTFQKALSCYGSEQRGKWRESCVEFTQGFWKVPSFLSYPVRKAYSVGGYLISHLRPNPKSSVQLSFVVCIAVWQRERHWVYWVQPVWLNKEKIPPLGLEYLRLGEWPDPGNSHGGLV